MNLKRLESFPEIGTIIYNKEQSLCVKIMSRPKTYQPGGTYKIFRTEFINGDGYCPGDIVDCAWYEDGKNNSWYIDVSCKNYPKDPL